MAAKKGGKSNPLMSILIGGGVGLAALIIIFLVTPNKTTTDGLKSMTQLVEYADDNVELPPMENKNFIKPDYTKFYKSKIPGFFSRNLSNLMRYAGLKDDPDFSAETLDFLLENVSQARETKGLRDKFIHKIVPTEKTKFYIWGDIQGAYHSLTRDLEFLRKEGVLSEELKLTSPDINFVFLGDVVSRSPYIMETLTVALRLLEQNPTQMFYMRGNHESDNYWHGYGLKRELKLRAGHMASGKEVVPLGALVERFFNTLPIALYVAVPPAFNSEFVRLSHEGGNEYTMETLDLNKYATFLKKVSGENLSTFNLAGQKLVVDPNPLKLRAAIRAEVKRKTYQSMNGMRALPPEKGVVSWTFISCPTFIYQKGLKFFNDAFGCLECGKKVNDWKISVYFQDSRTKDGFKKKTFNMLTSREIGEGAPSVATPAATPTPAAPAVAQPAAPPVAAVPVSTVPVKTVPATPVATPQTPPVAPVAAPAIKPVIPATPVKVVPIPAATPPAPAPVATPVVVTPAPVKTVPVVPVKVVPAPAPITPVPGPVPTPPVVPPVVAQPPVAPPPPGVIPPAPVAAPVAVPVPVVTVSPIPVEIPPTPPAPKPSAAPAAPTPVAVPVPVVPQ